MTDGAILGRVAGFDGDGNTKVVAHKNLEIHSGSYLRSHWVSAYAPTIVIDGTEESRSKGYSSHIAADAGIDIGDSTHVVDKLTLAGNGQIIVSGSNDLTIHANYLDVLGKSTIENWGKGKIAIHSGSGDKLSVTMDDSETNSTISVPKVNSTYVEIFSKEGTIELTGDDGVSVTGGKILSTLLNDNKGNSALIELQSKGGDISISGTDLITLHSADPTVKNDKATTGRVLINSTTKTDVGIAITDDSLIYANVVSIGNGSGKSKVLIADSTIWTAGDGQKSEYKFSINAGTDGLVLDKANLTYTDSNGGTTKLTSAGNIEITSSSVNDNVAVPNTEKGEDPTQPGKINGPYESGINGTLTVQSSKDGASIDINDSLLDDDAIVLGNGKENISIGEKSHIHVDGSGTMTITAKKVAISGGSAVGDDEENHGTDETGKTGTAGGGKVYITTPTLTLH